MLKPKGNEKSMGLSLGSSFELGALMPEVPLSLSLDWSMKNVASKENLAHSIYAGAEFVAASVIPFRVGFKSDQESDAKYISLGSGLTMDGVSFDALYQQHLTIGKYRHFGLALRVGI